MTYRTLRPMAPHSPIRYGFTEIPEPCRHPGTSQRHNAQSRFGVRGRWGTAPDVEAPLREA
jgi:hypothetical protein